MSAGMVAQGGAVPHGARGVAKVRQVGRREGAMPAGGVMKGSAAGRHSDTAMNGCCMPLLRKICYSRRACQRVAVREVKEAWQSAIAYSTKE